MVYPGRRPMVACDTFRLSPFTLPRKREVAETSPETPFSVMKERQESSGKVILMREALLLIREKLVRVLKHLADFAGRYQALPTLGFTHFQPAQLVTVGKRATLWMNELLMDLDEVSYRIDSLKLLGSKGTTGTQASFLELFEGDHEKCKELDRKIAAEMGFAATASVSGQTYSRKVDAAVLATPMWPDAWVMRTGTPGIHSSSTCRVGCARSSSTLWS